MKTGNHAMEEMIMTHSRTECLRVPPSPPPRNPFANAAKMRRGVEIHEKNQGAKRREAHMRLARVLRGDFSAMED
jgi:hypothetical protein